jgi:hypothetical protein
MDITENIFNSEKELIQKKIEILKADYEKFISLVSPKYWRTTGTHCVNLNEMSKDINRFELVTKTELKRIKEWEKETSPKTGFTNSIL